MIEVVEKGLKDDFYTEFPMGSKEGRGKKLFYTNLKVFISGILYL